MDDRYPPLGPTIIEAVLARGHRLMRLRGHAEWELDIAVDLLGVPSIFPMWAWPAGASIDSPNAERLQLIAYVSRERRISIAEMLRERSADASARIVSTLERMVAHCPLDLRRIYAEVGRLQRARRLANDFYEVEGTLGTLLVYACWYANGELRLLNFGPGFGAIERVWSRRRIVFEALPMAQPGRVIWGGSDPKSNVHHLSRTERYAVDFEPELHCRRPQAIAPVGGDVVAAHDGEFDELRPDDLRRATHRLGNFVTIRDADVDVTLAHLARGSVAVRAGQSIEAGTLVGIIGNSGRSAERHLHVQAAATTAPHHGVPIAYAASHDARREFVRGDVIMPR